MRDYTQKKYTALIECLSERYPTFSILDYIEAQRSQRLPESYFIMRHDVDGNPYNALAMARIDARCAVRASFYFRVKPFVFKPSVVKQIAELGHEIGYHYEVLSDAKKDLTKARCLFEANLRKIRSVAAVKTACMHGRSMSPYHNLDFWKAYTLAEFDLIAEPYLDIDYKDKYYFSDSSRCWNNSRYNVRDTVDSLGNSGIKSTDDLIDFLCTSGPKRGAILTHTNFWTDGWFSWSLNKCLFLGLNQFKRIKVERMTDRKKPAQS